METAIGRLLAFLAFMALFSALFQAGSMYQPGPEEARVMVDEFMELVSEIDGGEDVFIHNTLLALPMFIPGLGVLWGAFSGLGTGLMLAAIMSQNAALGQMQPLALLYLSPFGIMELAAYSIAGSRSLLLTVKIVRRRDLRRDVKPLALEVVMVVALLLAAGFVEYYMIEMAREGALAVPGL